MDWCMKYNFYFQTRNIQTGSRIIIQNIHQFRLVEGFFYKSINTTLYSFLLFNDFY